MRTNIEVTLLGGNCGNTLKVGELLLQREGDFGRTLLTTEELEFNIEKVGSKVVQLREFLRGQNERIGSVKIEGLQLSLKLRVTSESDCLKCSRVSETIEKLTQELNDPQEYDEEKDRVITLLVEKLHESLERTKGNTLLQAKHELIKERTEVLSELKGALNRLSAESSQGKNQLLLAKIPEDALQHKDLYNKQLKDLDGKYQTLLADEISGKAALNGTLLTLRRQLEETNQDREDAFAQLLAARTELSLAHTENSQLAQASALHTELLATLRTENSAHLSGLTSLQSALTALEAEKSSLKQELLTATHTISVLQSDQSKQVSSSHESSLSAYKAQVTSLESSHKITQCANSALLSQLTEAQQELSALSSVNLAQTEQLSSLTSLLELLNSQHAHSLKSLQAELPLKDTEIARLSQVLQKYKSIRPNYIAAKDDPVDTALAEYINTLDEPLDIQFIREDSGIYSYGSKRVFVKIIKGRLILRVGGGYMHVDEFIQIFTVPELEKIDKKHKIPHRRALYNKLNEGLPPSPRTCDVTRFRTAKAMKEDPTKGYVTVYGVVKRPETPKTPAPSPGLGQRRHNSVVS